jgi:hypothetical protein
VEAWSGALHAIDWAEASLIPTTNTTTTTTVAAAAVPQAHFPAKRAVAAFLVRLNIFWSKFTALLLLLLSCYAASMVWVLTLLTLLLLLLLLLLL